MGQSIFYHRGIFASASVQGKVTEAGCSKLALRWSFHMAPKSLFDGFPIKCNYVYFRAYIKNPQMNCKLFSVAAGVGKTLTEKPQAAVSELSKLK